MNCNLSVARPRTRAENQRSSKKASSTASSNKLYARAALAVAALMLAASAQADVVPGQVLLSQNFDSTTLAGWVKTNQSAQAASGGTWFQGNDSLFGAQSGATDSYLGADYTAAGGDLTGTLDLWLITPELTLGQNSLLTFFTRSLGEAGYPDYLEVLYSAGSGVATSGFHLLTSVGAGGTYPTDWTSVSALAGGAGSGRFALRYFNSTGTADYIGIDSLAVTAVPEPAGCALLALGLAGLVAARRKQRPSA